ncbi:MAG: dihydrofolate reductase [Parvularculaceae bacterium]
MTNIKRQTNIRLALVVAMANNNAIGKDGTLPWRLSDDLKWFKKVTTGKPIIMGRKTFDSLGKALPNRDNIVITRNRSFTAPDVTVASDLEDAIAIAEAFAVARNVQEICIIGGGEIYAQSLAIANHLYITAVDIEIKDADAYFPKINTSDWDVEKLADITRDSKNDHDADILIYKRCST